jgi:tetratricopeptide (TPR) repeat protein
MKPAQYVELYTRLLQRHPALGSLLARRAANHGCLDHWQQAAADYTAAARLAHQRPFDPGYQSVQITMPDPEARKLAHDQLFEWEAWGAVCLRIGDSEGYRTACREALTRLPHDLESANRMDLVVLCSLAPESGVDRAKIERIAEATLAESPPRPFYRLARGMVAYRAGHFREAAALLPEAGANPKDEVLTLLFRAMTYHRLGDADAARTALASARRAMERPLPAVGSPLLASRDPCVLRCMFQVVLREAEALIEPKEKPAAEGSAAGTHTQGS